MSNPNNNKNFNDEALKINRQLKKDNDNLKTEIKSLWSDISELEKQLANYKSLKKELEEIYEALVGDNGMERFTHAELIDWIYQLIDDESLEYINKKERKDE